MTQKLEAAMNPTSMNIVNVLANATGRTAEEVVIDFIDKTTLAKKEAISLIIGERLISLLRQTNNGIYVSIEKDAFETAIAKCKDKHVPELMLLQAIHDNTGASIRWLCGGENHMYDIAENNYDTAREMYNIIINENVFSIKFFTLGQFMRTPRHRYIIIATHEKNHKFKLFKFDLMPEPGNVNADANKRKMAILINFCLAVEAEFIPEGIPLSNEHFDDLIGQSSYPGKNFCCGSSTWPQDIWDFDFLRGRNGILRDTAIDISNFITTLRDAGDAGLHDDREWARTQRKILPQRVWWKGEANR